MCTAVVRWKNSSLGEPAQPLTIVSPDVRGTVAPARGEVGPTRGITVIAAPGAAAAAVMPGVRRTPGLQRGREARGGTLL